MRTHSPFQKTIVAPVKDLEKYRKEVRYYRSQDDDDGLDRYAGADLLRISEILIEHCDFLEAKMDIKVQEITKLQKEVKWLEERIEILEKGHTPSEITQDVPGMPNGGAADPGKPGERSKNPRKCPQNNQQ